MDYTINKDIQITKLINFDTGNINDWMADSGSDHHSAYTADYINITNIGNFDLNNQNKLQLKPFKSVKEQENNSEYTNNPTINDYNKIINIFDINWNGIKFKSNNEDIKNIGPIVTFKDFINFLKKIHPKDGKQGPQGSKGQQGPRGFAGKDSNVRSQSWQNFHYKWYNTENDNNDGVQINFNIDNLNNISKNYDINNFYSNQTQSNYVYTKIEDNNNNPQYVLKIDKNGHLIGYKELNQQINN